MKSLGRASIEDVLSKMIINQANKKIEIFKYLKSYTENKILELSTTSITPISSIPEIDKKETVNTDISQIKTEIISYIDSKWKFDPNKKVYSREGACEYLQITDRKLTTLLDGKITPVSYAVKPYTFNIEELELIMYLSDSYL